MKLFSKRIKGKSRNQYVSRLKSMSFGIRTDSQLIESELRNRLAAEILFITSRDDFLEWFILFENKKEGVIFLDGDKVDGFSLSELGYKMSDFFNFVNFSINEIDLPIKHRDTSKIDKITYFDDYKLFDLIEFLILFSKKDQRDNVINRFKEILNEENVQYTISNGVIEKSTGENLWSIKNLINSSSLKSKLEDYDYYYEQANYVNAAKVSAEILNIIFSGSVADIKKSDIETKLKNLSAQLSKVKSEQESLYVYLNSHLKSIKDLNNNIYNVRHTEQSTIHLDNGDESILYKMIAECNISFIEVVIVNMKSDFIISENWETIKDNYIDKYQINRHLRLTIQDPNRHNIDDVRVEDLPF